MQDAGHAEFRRTDVFISLGQLDQRTISGLEDRFVTFSGMRSNEASKLLRNREGDHEIRARQGPFKLFLKPCLGFGALARRTMSIATRLWDLVDVSTVLASVDHETQLGSATAHDRFYRFDLIRRHAILILSQIRWSVGSKDVVDRRPLVGSRLMGHDFLRMMLLILAIAYSSPTVVV